MSSTVLCDLFIFGFLLLKTNLVFTAPIELTEDSLYTYHRRYLLSSVSESRLSNLFLFVIDNELTND